MVSIANQVSAYVFNEEIIPMLKLSQKKFLANTEEMALSSTHGLAFHRGLGEPINPTSSTPTQKYLTPETIGAYSTAAYAPSNFAIVANGVDHAELSKWVGEFFKDYKVTPTTGVIGGEEVTLQGPKIESTQTKYHGGEERIAHAFGNSMVLGFPGSSSFTGGFYKPEIQVLASLLGGETNIKWSPSFSLLAKATADKAGLSVKTKSAIYTDAGLLYVALNGSAQSVATGAIEAVRTIKDVAASKIAKEDIQKAKANAKLKELEFGQQTGAGIALTGAGLVHGGKAYQIDQVAKAIDGVTEEKVKQVSNLTTYASIRIKLTSSSGCGRVVEAQGKRIGRGRSVRTALRGRVGPDGVNMGKVASKSFGVLY
jgi:ubiquinol-cytochrome c reductase core subunit 2